MCGKAGILYSGAATRPSQKLIKRVARSLACPLACPLARVCVKHESIKVEPGASLGGAYAMDHAA